jgi:drug/metabolite transporter (DMT)-like permease
MALLAALASAVAMLGLNRLKGVNPWAVVTHYSGVATAVMVLVLAAGVVGDLAGVPLGGTPDLAPLARPTVLLLLLGVGVAATAGQVCVTNAYTYGQPARVAVVQLTQILFALGLDLTFGRPGIQLVTLGGIALILAPTAWVMADRAARQAAPPAPARPLVGGVEK